MEFIKLKQIFTAVCAVGIFGLCTNVSAEPVSGGALNLMVQPEPPTLNLGVNKLGPTSFVGSKIYESLVTLSHELKPIPRLAESWEVSDDGLNYKFNLRKNVKWHDGQPFTSDDVVFSFTKFLPTTTPRTKNIMLDVESINAIDDYTVEFKLKRPFPALFMILESTGGTIMPKHLYEGVDEYLTTPVNNTIVGTGPFKLKEWQKGSHIHLVKNDDYWDEGKPYLDELFFHIVPDANSRSIAFESGKVDVIRAGDVENFEINQLAELPNVEITNKGWEYFDPIAELHINLRNKPMDDLRFRQALSHAIDRNFIINNIFFGFGRELNSPFSDGYKYKNTDFDTKYEYSPEKAKALLDEMGLKPDSNGVRVELRLLPLPYGETWQRLGEFVREQLNKVGIKANIVATDVPGWYQRLVGGDFDLGFNYVYQLGDPAIVMSETFVTADGPAVSTLGNLGGYSNKSIDQVMLDARHMQSDSDRQSAYNEIQKVLSKELPILWLHQMDMPTLYQKKIQNLITTGLGMNENFADVWIKK